MLDDHFVGETLSVHSLDGLQFYLSSCSNITKTHIFLVNIITHSIIIIYCIRKIEYVEYGTIIT